MCDLKNKAYLQEKVRQALERLYKYDLDLIDLKGVEWSISTRIAMHLHTVLSCHERIDGTCRYRIDCEYNKMGTEPKPAPKASNRSSMRPDIIIHSRAGKNGDASTGNILFCEVKLGDQIDDDEQKVKHAVNNELNYLFGLQIYNINTDNISVKWYCRDDSNCTNDPKEVIIYRWDSPKLEIDR